MTRKIPHCMWIYADKTNCCTPVKHVWKFDDDSKRYRAYNTLCEEHQRHADAQDADEEQDAKFIRPI